MSLNSSSIYSPKASVNYENMFLASKIQMISPNDLPLFNLEVKISPHKLATRTQKSRVPQIKNLQF